LTQPQTLESSKEISNDLLSLKEINYKLQKELELAKAEMYQLRDELIKVKTQNKLLSSQQQQSQQPQSQPQLQQQPQLQLQQSQPSRGTSSDESKMLKHQNNQQKIESEQIAHKIDTRQQTLDNTTEIISSLREQLATKDKIIQQLQQKLESLSSINLNPLSKSDTHSAEKDDITLRKRTINSASRPSKPLLTKDEEQMLLSILLLVLVFLAILV
jgi:hypothetical protein